MLPQCKDCINNANGGCADDSMCVHAAHADKLKALEKFIEHVWRYSAFCWDTLDELEKEIAAMTGETEERINKKYASGNKAIRERETHKRLSSDLGAAHARIAELELQIDNLESTNDVWIRDCEKLNTDLAAVDAAMEATK